MKLIFFFAAIIITSFACAQEKKYSDLLPKRQNTYSDLLKRYRNPGLKTSLPKTEPLKPFISAEQPKSYYLLPNGNKVYSLPQDNMPCIVPDMSQYNPAIPVQPYQYKGPDKIPNPSEPLHLEKKAL